MQEFGSKLIRIENGEWSGWQTWRPEPFEEVAGPFYFRRTGQLVVCAFRPEARHLNGAGSVHGGCLMSFADFALFAFSEPHWSGLPAATVSATCDFVGAAKAGDLIEARGETIHSTRSMIFARGTAQVEGRPILAFSGVLKVARLHSASQV